MTAPISEAAIPSHALDLRMFTIKQVREHTGLGTTTIYGLLASGDLKAKKAGKRTLVTAESLVAYLNNLPDAVLTTYTCRRAKK